MKNKKNNCYFESHKSKHYHRNCSEKNKRNKTIVIMMTIFNSKNGQSFTNVLTTKQKRLIKTKNSILIKKWVQFSNEENLLTAFIDSKIKINVINQIYVIHWELQSMNIDLWLSKFLNNQNEYCYNVYELIYNILNS